MRSVLASLSVSSFLMLACEHQEPSDLEVIPGAYVDYRYSPGLQPCTGNAAAVNAYSVYAASALKIPLDEVPQLSFSWVTPEDLDSWTGGACSHSCAIGRGAFSLSPVLYHELAHAVFYGVNPRPAHFLSEGSATVLDPFQLINFTKVGSRDPRHFLTDPSFSSGYYAMAGLFVAYLIQIHGIEKFLALYQAIPRESNLSDWEGAFQAIYGETLDNVVDDYLSSTECPPAVSPFPQFECDAPLLAPEGEGWSYGRSLDCDGDDVVGSIDSDVGRTTTVTFVVDNPGDYDVEFLVPPMPNSLMRIGACDECRWLPQESVLGGGQSARVTLEQGRHFLTVRAFETEPNDVFVSITPAQ